MPDSPPGNPPHETGFDPPAGQQKPELFDRLRETFSFPTVSPPRRISPSPLTPRTLVSLRVTWRVLHHSFAAHVYQAARRGAGQARTCGEFLGIAKAAA